MSLILLLAAVVCEAIAALVGFEVINSKYQFGWLAVGLALYLASLVVPDR